MSFEVNKNCAADCSRDVETCPLVEGLFADDHFFAAASIEDSDKKIRVEAHECRRVIANLLDLCVVGDCPGQKPELFGELARIRRED